MVQLILGQRNRNMDQEVHQDVQVDEDELDFQEEGHQNQIHQDYLILFVMREGEERKNMRKRATKGWVK